MSRLLGDRERRLDYCIVGTQKSATSTLSEVLTRHRLIQRAPRKELHWFDNESRDWSSGDYSDLELPPRPQGEPQLIGDATPLYLWWPQALERMHAYNPDLKLVAIFRDPIERLFSQWMMVVTRWPNVASDWPKFLTRFAPDGLEGRIPESENVHGYRMHSGVVRGYYGAQLERAVDVFGADQLHVLEFRAFLSRHTAALDGITDFLGVHRYRRYPELPHSMRGRDQVTGTGPTGADIERLVETYRDDFARFKQLSGLDVREWPLQRLIDGSLKPEELAAQYAAKVVAPETP